MTVTIELEPELEQWVQLQARARGLTVEFLIHDYVLRHVRVLARSLVIADRNPGKRATKRTSDSE